MKKFKTVSIIFFVVIIILCGCWDSRDIEEISIPIVGGYDLKNNEDTDLPELAISGVFPIINPDAVSSATVGTIYSHTIGESRTKRALKSPQSLLFGMLQAAVYGEDLAKMGLSDYCDILLRNPQVKLNIYVAIVEGKVRDLLEDKITNYPNTGKYIVDLLKNAPKDSLIPYVTLHELAISFYNKETNAVVPIIKSVDNGIAIVGMGILNGDRLVAKTNLDEAHIISFLRSDNVKGFIPFYGEDHEAGSIRVLRHSRKIKVKKERNRFVFTLDIHIVGSMVEFFQKEPLTEYQGKLKKIEKSVKEELEKQCDAFINKMQYQYKVDCINITRYAAAKWRKEIEQQGIQNFIKNTDINVNIDIDINSIGELE